ncbi:phage Gp37Gp68 [Nitrobacter winogradskyi Nb-255]|uniref:Phage Gp37Gp68 n=1 Tax=Nitrobacter winogradskyi (strain ATCC 25391 / DSM 10237 / CIP 104748 / NCIMB 11846 / Nb-255) TaxID=323098 RepID=Q3SSB6_NITWN|nr:phage Gp37/Gp68 family protein [Nitrobacter winogradskyi]ABA04825.1 phage Gp37Gp68 [Nitrobacter winogradskyi Nb-255]
MAEHSTIEWTDATWQPITGCSVVSPGCTNCYAMRLAGTRLKHHPSRANLTTMTKGGPVWNGAVRLNPEWLTQPLGWKRPRRIFVCAHGDLFHESVPDEWIDQIFAVMALTPQHTYQVLTKRSARMRDYICTRAGDWQVVLPDACAPGTLPITKNDVARALGRLPKFSYDPPTPTWPLANVWLGVSTERQKEADERIPDLLATPAAVHFISAEPLLGPIDLTAIKATHVPGTPDDSDMGWTFNSLATGDYYSFKDDRGYNEGGDGPHREHALDWVIVGGESGPDARPMHPDWARSIRDQCAAAGVPFFFKQWGSWYPIVDRDKEDPDWRADYGRASRSPEKFRILNLAGGCGFHGDSVHLMQRYSKSATGRLLDGVTYDAMPKAVAEQLIARQRPSIQNAGDALDEQTRGAPISVRGAPR